MWLALAFLSAALLGLYDTAKKASLKDNAVIPVLFLNTVFSTLIFSPSIISSIAGQGGAPSGETGLLQAHLLTFAKSCIVLTSWLFGYFGLKHLPITIVGPINATRPILVLLGAMLLFGERLNGWQWGGVVLAMVSLLLLGRSGKKENIDFARNKWIWLIAAAALTGACSGLYDKYIMRMLDATFVQGWYNFYQMLLMGLMMLLLWLPNRRKSTPFHWSWAIPLISVFISAADFAYLSALRQPDSMISVVSLVRRSSVIVSFLCGALIFKERNLKAKALDLAFILVGMVLIWIGSR
ncbi:MAG: EamA family transporter [Candidatus Cryptobacteroides sp.]